MRNRITIHKDLCIGCKKCEADCTSLSIHIDNFTVENTCIACGHCVAICESSAIQFENKPTIELHKPTISPDEFYNLSTHTRTCRNFTTKPIEFEIVKKLLDNMANYPSASNSRKVEVTIITNPDVIKRLNDFSSQTLYKLFSTLTKPIVKQILQVFISKSEANKLVKYKALFERKMKNNPNNITYEAPLVMIFHAKKNKTGMLQTDADIWSTYTSLYASTFGLGTCFNGFIVKALQGNTNAKIEFGIPKENEVFISILIGYPKFNYTNETGRNIPRYTIIK